MKHSSISRLVTFLFVSSLMLLFNSCRKETTTNNETRVSNLAMIAKINSWLDENKQADTSKQSKAILESVRESLDFNKLSFEKLNNKEKFCVVPLKDAFYSGYNVGKYKITNAVFIINENDSIRKGNIVQFLPDNRQSITAVPKNTFYKIFNHESLDHDGKFSFLSIKDKLIWEIGYKDKRPFSYGIVEARESATSANEKVNQCINWFLTTTIYFTDGSHYSTEEYVGTSCDDMCTEVKLANGRSYRFNCGGGSGGGGGTELPPKGVDWVVGASGQGFWQVKSFETLNGVRTEPGPNGGYFTGITHNTSAIINNVQNEPGLPYGTWTQLQATVVLQSSGGLAKSTVKGKITFASFPDAYLDNFKVWFFYVEYP